MKPPFLKVCLIALLTLVFALPVFAKNVCLKEGRQSAECRGIHNYFFAKYKMQAAARAGDRVLALSCDLRVQLEQCREYSVLASASETLAEMQAGCTSMGGKFSNVKCPDENSIGACVNVVRNYHRPDVIYDNLYYQSQSQTGAKEPRKLEELKQICADLGGSFLTQ